MTPRGRGNSRARPRVVFDMGILWAPLLLAAPALAEEPKWTPLADGVERTRLVLEPHPRFGDGLLQVVRIDPARAELRFALASENKGGKRTAGEWADAQGFVAVINAGMFATDHLTNVGLLLDGAHQNNKAWHAQYQSVLAFGPRKPELPGAVLLDLDQPGAREATLDYRQVVQNLRLLKGSGENVWTAQDKQWSEAAVAADASGRILFLFARSPLSMHDFNARLKALPLNVVRAMHVEGGPEASLSIRAEKTKEDYCGSFESLFRDDDSNTTQWPLPNVIGVIARKPPAR